MMNELIKELLDQVGGYGTQALMNPEQIEKFAELLLEEVMQTLFINGYEDAFDMLNKHFGIEE